MLTSSLSNTSATGGLSPEQIASFDRDGFLVLRKHITGLLLTRLQDAGSRMIARALASEEEKAASQTQETEIATDYAFAKRPEGKRVPFRVDYLHNQKESATLEVLGSPEILSIAESLAGKDFVPTYESMVFKMPGDGEIIPWHQDAVFQNRRFRVFNIDIYLDRAGQDSGALRVIPGSQTSVHNVCKRNDGSYDWTNGPHTTVEMEPGDVLVHDDMILHGSPRTLNNALRRVVYFEFRPLQQILTEGPWDIDFANQRLRLIPLALNHHQRQFPESPQFHWQIDPIHRPPASTNREDELRTFHTTHTPGSYCSANSL